MSESLSDNASNISILSDDTTISTQPSSLRCSSDEGQASPISEPSELSYKEIQALKQYSHSVQNFTYQLFENFRLSLEAKGRPSPLVTIVDPSTTQKTNSESPKADTVGFHSSNLTIDNTESPPAFKPASTEQIAHNTNTNTCNRRRKPSDYPRRKKRDGPAFPEDTGL
ncbi:hypothetical protein PSTG_07077 [Puccinia striiformis f. sp. tritici PST-78]|uniref:Uncharacterized protein n=1 Tax=Puccinia striiformis f. sp. tritici PST-78 TaxID=1165861 RepID=A0A0L0VJY3_9BASI|nr:hypothetical protein PSTG_07077 [Puccinia striiformis f. sp. tritici PST-78]